MQKQKTGIVVSANTILVYIQDLCIAQNCDIELRHHGKTDVSILNKFNDKNNDNKRHKISTNTDTKQRWRDTCWQHN